MSRSTPLDKAFEDYDLCTKLLSPYAHYLTINVSSPNTPGLRDLQQIPHLRKLIRTVRNTINPHFPLCVKISPDLDFKDLDDITDLCVKEKIWAIAISNTTVQRPTSRTTYSDPQPEAGGLSGPPLRDLSNSLIFHVYQKTKGKLPIIGIGGIDSGEAAWDKITAGASLIQVFTGYIYEGPFLSLKIRKYLSKQCKEHEFSNIREAVGLSARISTKYANMVKHASFIK